MNTDRNMRSRRSLFGSIALSLIVGVIGGMVWGITPAQAATVDSTLTLPVSGTVTTTDGTNINFSGTVLIKSSAVTDAPDTPPFTILTFDTSNVTGTSGKGASMKTYDTGGYQVVKIRDLKPTDVISMTVPVDLAGASVTLAKEWLATFTVNFNATGQLTSGSVTATANTTTTSSATGTVQVVP
ncbi:MAG TPA: hypothetical protein VF762_14890 [Blastocatellia bacterium]